LIRLALRRLLASAALVGACVLPAAAPVSAAENEVLDLDEAAALLRLPPQSVRALAESRRIPARRVGNTWRFSRSALLAWLEGDQAGGVLAVPPAAPAQGAAAPPKPAASEKPAVAPEAAAAPPTVGERPAAPTAEEVALRDQRVLLKRNAATIELGMSYTHSEQTLFPVARVEQQTGTASATLRYGLIDDLQLTLRVPRVWRRTSTFTDAAVSGTLSPSVTSDSYNGDASVSLLGVALHEAAGLPNIIVSLDAVVPYGTGDQAVGGGVVFSKSYDPAVIFAGLSYLNGVHIDPTDPRRALAKRNAGVSLGYTYALNDSLALSTIFFGLYRNAGSTDGVSIPPPRERYQLQLGLTWMLARGLFIEPAVAMRLGGEGPDMTFSLNIPYSF
jgi:excisionase family DNA binding protein